MTLFEFAIILNFLISICLVIYIIYDIVSEPFKRKKKKKMPFPECKRGCDVNQCTTWCMAKERFKNNPPD